MKEKKGIELCRRADAGKKAAGVCMTYKRRGQKVEDVTGVHFFDERRGQSHWGGGGKEGVAD